MPRYVYQCPKCGEKSERTTRIADRDDQICRRISDEKESTLLGPSFIEYIQCSAKLVRDEISETGRMDYQWGNWRHSK